AAACWRRRWVACAAATACAAPTVRNSARRLRSSAWPDPTRSTEVRMTVYAVGDIQGCLKPLQCLLQEVDFNPSRDTLWAAGDLVNRGPSSLETLRFLDNPGNAGFGVVGNQSLQLRPFPYVVKGQRTTVTLRPILEAPDRERLLGNLRERPLAHLDVARGVIMTHA